MKLARLVVAGLVAGSFSLVGCAAEEPAGDGTATGVVASDLKACRNVEGMDINAVQIPCPAGSTGDGFCEKAVMTGDISGANTFVEQVSGIEGSFYIGAETVTNASGTLKADERGSIDFNTGGMVFMWTLQGGTGKYANATGQLFWQGNLFTGKFKYNGQLCTTR